MYYYKHGNSILISKTGHIELESCSQDEAEKCSGGLFLLNRLDPLVSRRKYSVSDVSLTFLEKEDINLIRKAPPDCSSLPGWLIDRIVANKAASINTGYPDWLEALAPEPARKWKVNVVGLGDVGGILVTGLRLMGGDCIEAIGIYDIDENKMRRWEFETSQIFSPESVEEMPPVTPLRQAELFDCDMFVFCVTAGVPPLGETKDVRLAQFEGNSRIVSLYARMARQKGFKGVFAVVSDPVDLLCKAAFIASNTDDFGNMDFKGLASDRIRGYGLGVMHARAIYYSRLNEKAFHYKDEGRAFGPHGEGLIIADSITNYDSELSLWLTDKARKANLAVRDTGFKPYIAPALSSGALSLIATIRGQWHYSATYMGGVFWGSRNRLLLTGTELERFDLPDKLFARISESYEGLGAII